MGNDEIQLLFEDFRKNCKSRHVMMITRICLSTCARWREIESWKDHHFKNNQLYLTFTKSRKNRIIPPDEALFPEVKQHIMDKGELTN